MISRRLNQSCCYNHICLLQVKSTNGDTFLGGEDFDNVLMKYLADQFKKEVGLSVSGGKVVSRSKVVSGGKVALRNSFDVTTFPTA